MVLSIKAVALCLIIVFINGCTVVHSQSGQGQAPELRTTNITVQRAYISWRQMPQAMFYLAERSYNSRFTDAYRVFEGGGLDFFDPMVKPGTTMYYRIKGYNPATGFTSNWLSVNLNVPAAKTLQSSARADMETAVVTVQGTLARKRAGGFSPADVGKIISIKNARRPLWYSRGTYGWNGFITAVNNGVATLGIRMLPNGRRLGDPISELSNTTDSCLMGTNNYAAITADLIAAKAGGFNEIRYPANGTCLIDPYRDSLWMSFFYYSTNSVRGHANDFDITISGLRARYCYEDFMFQNDDPTTFPPYTRLWEYHAWTVWSGVLKLDSCQFTGVSNRARNNERANGHFGSAPPNGNHQEFFLTNSVVKGGGDWTTGFSSGITMSVNKPKQKQTLHFQNCNIENAEWCGAGDNGNNLSDEAGIRLTYRNVVLRGTGMPTHLPPVQARVAGGILTVDSGRFSQFTFAFQQREMNRREPRMAGLAMKPAGNPNNQTLDYGAKNAVLNNYQCRTTAPDGIYTLIYYKGGDGDNGGLNGHANYVNTNVEVYCDSVVHTNAWSFFMRRNNPDTWTGSHRQTTYQLVWYQPEKPGDNPYPYFADMPAVDWGGGPLKSFNIQFRSQCFNPQKQALVRRASIEAYRETSAANAWVENTQYNGTIGMEGATSYLRNVNGTVVAGMSASIEAINNDTCTLVVRPHCKGTIQLTGGYFGFASESTIPCGYALQPADSLLITVRNAKIPNGAFYLGGASAPGPNEPPYCNNRFWVEKGQYRFDFVNCTYDDKRNLNANYKRLYIIDLNADFGNWNNRVKQPQFKLK